MFAKLCDVPADCVVEAVVDASLVLCAKETLDAQAVKAKATMA